MITRYTPTEDELELLDFARRVLGGTLSELLLSGLGESQQPRRQYMARSIRAHGPGIIHQFAIISESADGLPGGRDPLVLVAVLHLLWTGDAGRDEVVFRDEALLERLGWLDTSESRHAIATAVERYFSMVYRRTSTEAMGAGCGDRISSHVQKLIAGYEVTSERLTESQGEVRRSTIVQFTPKLVEEVSGGEKYFLGIDFEKLERLQRVIPGIGEEASLNGIG